MNTSIFRVPGTQLLLLCLLLSCFGLSGQSNALHFAGGDDSLAVPISQLLPSDLDTISVEFWYRGESDPQQITTRSLLSLSNASGTIELSLFANQLSLARGDGSGGLNEPLSFYGPVPSNSWQHLRLDVIGDSLTIYMDCIQRDRLFTGLTGPVENMWLGGETVTGFTFAESWVGEVESFKIWTGPRRFANNVCVREYCVPDVTNPNLLVYYDFNQGAAAGANTGIGAVENRTLTPGLDGELYGFTLNGPTSNFVMSTAPLVGEALVNLRFEIRDYPYRTMVLDSICSGDPVTFCLGPDGPPGGLPGPVAVDWEYSDDGGTTWTVAQMPPFTDFCFPVPPNLLTADCATNPLGYIDRLFRAQLLVFDPVSGTSCDYLSETDTLRIRCAVTDPVVTIVPGGPFCAQDTALLEVELQTAHPWLNSSGTDTEIVWTLSATNEPTITLATPPNATTFTYPFLAPALSAQKTFTFTATITSCAGTVSFSAGVTVDPEPIAGDIIGLPSGNPRNLTELFPPDNPVYDICPGEDATIGVRPFLEPMFCIPQWQYTFDLSGTVVWQDLGFSNSSQNTNILPTSQWPGGADRIYYRYRCDPENQPSGCEPAFSDTLEIRLRPLPVVPQIVGPAEICLGDNTVLTLVNPEAGIDYYWYHDGLLVAGPTASYSVDTSGNFQVVADNGCVQTEGPLFQIDEIEVVPVMSCPLQPNDCLRPGDEVTLSASASFVVDRPNATLTYSWLASSGEAGTGQTFTYTAHPNTTPPLTPTTITLTVTDSTTGCAVTISRTITPCGNRF